VENRQGLFGALVHSRVPSVNVQLDIPDLLDSADVIIPTFHKHKSVEVGTISVSVFFCKIYDIFNKAVVIILLMFSSDLL